MTQKNAAKHPSNAPSTKDAPNGVPNDAGSAEAKGTPTSDRQKTETASKPK